MRRDWQHFAISLTQSAPMTQSVFVIGDLTQLAAFWLYFYIKAMLSSTSVIWQLHFCPAATTSLFVEVFLFQISEVLAELWM